MSLLDFFTLVLRSEETSEGWTFEVVERVGQETYNE